VAAQATLLVEHADLLSAPAAPHNPRKAALLLKVAKPEVVVLLSLARHLSRHHNLPKLAQEVILHETVPTA
jgi:hypothetical protein